MYLQIDRSIEYRIERATFSNIFLRRICLILIHRLITILLIFLSIPLFFFFFVFSFFFFPLLFYRTCILINIHLTGTFQKLLIQRRVRLYTTTTVLDSFKRKYAALTGFTVGFLEQLFIPETVLIG